MSSTEILTLLQKTTFVFLILFSFGCQPNSSEKLNIATAANMQFATKKLVDKFTQQTGIECNTIISSSGKLTAQIMEGAPYPILLSADMMYPQKLYQLELTLGPPMAYAYGKLALWSLEHEPSLSMLLDKNTKHIAIPNPKMAPYGRAGLAVLKSLGNDNLWENKLVYGESIAQTNQFILSGAAEIGFTSQSVVMSDNMINQGNWIPVDHELPIEQGVVLIKSDSVSAKKAQLFYDFLFSEDAKSILTQAGYSVNNTLN